MPVYQRRCLRVEQSTGEWKREDADASTTRRVLEQWSTTMFFGAAHAGQALDLDEREIVFAGDEHSVAVILREADDIETH